MRKNNLTFIFLLDQILRRNPLFLVIVGFKIVNNDKINSVINISQINKSIINR